MSAIDVDGRDMPGHDGKETAIADHSWTVTP
jgi:hypothetical protein